MRIPFFVLTLAGLLGWNGVVLLLVADRGTIPIDNPVIVGVANSLLTPDQGWLVLIVGVALYVAFLSGTYIVRRRRNLTVDPLPLPVFRAAAVPALGTVAVYVGNHNRGRLIPIQGVPVITVLIIVMLVVLTILAGRTKFGRHVYAVGGNAHAPRPPGINLLRR